MSQSVLHPGIRSASCSPAVAQLLMEIEGQAVKPQPKSKPVAKDYAKENVKRLKEIQAKNKIKEEEKKKPVKGTWKSDKYDHVPAKIASAPKTSIIYHKPLTSTVKGSCSIPDLCIEGISKSNPLALCPSSPEIKKKQLPSSPEVSFRRSSSSMELSQEDKKSPKSSESDTSRSPTCSEIVRGKDIQTKANPTHRRGEVPKYLLERKKQWKEEEIKRKAEIEKASIPAGFTLLGDEERLETLQLLKKNQAELLLKLASLPIRNDTLRLRQRKEELDKQLAKVEEGIRIFSRHKVLIKNDA